MTEPIDLVDMLLADHQEIRRLLDQLDVAEDPDDIRRLFLAVAVALSTHEAAEQHVVFPALAGTRTAEARAHEHDEINRLLDEMRSFGPDEWGFDKRESALVLEVLVHFQREEEKLFPLLRATFPTDRLIELTAEAQRAKAAAPPFPAVHG